MVSLNLANIETVELEDCCQISVRILDNTIDLTSPPFEDAANHNNKYRTIGVGAMGLADWLAKNRLSYDHLTEISHLLKTLVITVLRPQWNYPKNVLPIMPLRGVIGVRVF